MRSRQFITCALTLAAAGLLQGCSGGSGAGNATPAAGGSAAPATAAGGAYPSLPPPAALAPSAASAASTAPVASAPAPAVASAPASGSDSPIEVGCTYAGSQIAGPAGTRKLLNCPLGCFDRGWIWGTEHYPNDSTICNAAIHAGVIPAEGGNVVVTREEGRPAYRGSRRNGIESADYGEFESGFRVQKP